ncbi:MAG: ATP-grasp domain-containing protein [Stackebrandtia sp.]
MPTVAIVTCAELPQLDDDETLLLEPLVARGIEPVPAVWTDTAVDWDSFDATVIRCPWDYTADRPRFLAWARSVPRLYNRAALLEWNTDKRYLGQLAGRGVPVVPTTWLPPSTRVELPDAGEWVLKPSVGAGSRDAGRYLMGDVAQRERAQELVARLHANGTTVMAQPYLDDVDTTGERALIYIDGVFSHAVRKHAMLDGPWEDGVGLFKPEVITPATATESELSLGKLVLDAVDGEPPLYARVDVVGSGDSLLLLELELTEPSLFYTHAEGAADRMAEAVTTRLAA